MKILNIFYVAFSFRCIFSLAEIAVPNYQFQIEQLAPFFPGEKFSENQGVLWSQKGTNKVFKIQIKHQNYHFPLFVLVSSEQLIEDTYVRLPSYFLHDPFHQLLIDKFGKQKNYQLKEGTALYLFETNAHNLVYSSTCTITCFPLYLNIVKKNQKNYFLQEMLLNEPVKGLRAIK